MRVPSAMALAGTLLALAVPGSALAQGAGDDQYTDPFGSETPTPTPTPEAPQAAPAPSAAPAAPPSSPSAQSAAAPSAQPQAQLPYTGSPVEAGLLAAAGGLLLAGGLTLRVRLRDP